MHSIMSICGRQGRKVWYIADDEAGMPQSFAWAPLLLRLSRNSGNQIPPRRPQMSSPRSLSLSSPGCAKSSVVRYMMWNVQGSAKRLFPGCVNNVQKNCAILPAVGKQNATYSSKFTKPGKGLLVQPCTLSHGGTQSNTTQTPKKSNRKPCCFVQLTWFPIPNTKRTSGA